MQSKVTTLWRQCLCVVLAYTMLINPAWLLQASQASIEDASFYDKVEYSYDQLGRLNSVTLRQYNSQPVNESTAYSYNPTGSLETIDYPNGNSASYTYDNLNRLTRLEHRDTNRIIASYDYTLGADGIRKTAREIVYNGSDYDTTNINWMYDALNRLTAEDYNAPDYSNDFEHNYVYDIVGNRLQKIADGNTTTYSYDSLTDELLSEHTPDVNTFYDYDDNGSLVAEYNDVSTVRDYSYNLRGRLSSVTAGGVTANFTYDVDGFRVSTDNGTTAEKYLVDPFNHTGYAQVLKQSGGQTGEKRFYVIGSDVIGQAYSHQSPQYFIYDGHGSVRRLTDSWGGVAESYSYDAYGNARGFNPASVSTRLLYCGEMFDQHTAQYYLRARWYSPNTGRFNRPDPFSGNSQDPQSLHKYLYAHANPVMYSDPSGNALLLGGGFIFNFTVQTAIRATIAAVVFGVLAFTFAKIRGATWTQAIWAGIRGAAITGLAFLSPLFAWGLLAVSPVIIGAGIWSGEISKEDVPEIAAYIVAGILLMILFKTPQYEIWEIKTAIKLKLPQALNNLRTGNSIAPGRNAKWARAVEAGDRSAQGSLIHGELADLLRVEKMTNLKVEVSYNSSGDIVEYGTKESIRLDYGVYHNETLIKSFDLKPGDVIEGSWLRKASQYTTLSAEDFEAISYGGK